MPHYHARMDRSIERSIDTAADADLMPRLLDGRHATERRIHEAAVRLFYERGYEGTSMRALAMAVGMEMSSHYYHYRSKQDLLVQILERAMTDLIGEVTQAIAGTRDPVERLRAAIAAHILFHSVRGREAFIADSELRALDPANRAEIVTLRDQYERIFETILRDGVMGGQFDVPDLKVTVLALMGLCSGVASWFKADGRLSLSSIATMYSDILLNGIKGSAQ
jgi:AcrR family transcriptional regulator